MCFTLGVTQTLQPRLGNLGGMVTSSDSGNSDFSAWECVMLCLPRSQGISLLVGLRFALVRNTQQLGHDIAFPKPIHFEDLCVWLNNYSNKNKTFSPFSLQMIGNIPILLSFLFFFFIKIKPSHFTATLVRTDQCFHLE